VVAAMYAVHHGPEGIREIARRTHGAAARLARTLRGAGTEVVHGAFFDTLLLRVPGRADAVVAAARDRGVHLRRVDADHVGVATSETTRDGHLAAVVAACGADPRLLDDADGGGGGDRRGRRQRHQGLFEDHRSLLRRPPAIRRPISTPTPRPARVAVIGRSRTRSET